MEERNIVLIGFMGSGKSSVARLLGQQLKREVISSDEWIVDQEQCPIAEIFRNKGEAYFRQLEKKAIAAIAQKQGIIIDCGGGVVLQQENIDILKKNGLLIYLAATVEFLYSQIQANKDRPLLNVADPLTQMKQLLEQRESQYEQADIKIDSTDKSIDWIAQEIVKRIK
ncbi:MAG: shikimate kinase [Candidatus Omnitrophica bacterium]|nr:shikimate kinase [Candidatus Omnitrophota bacterium]MCB9746851.1 shikimate kinase [Candidatus Omnitrophota bacterium]